MKMVSTTTSDRTFANRMTIPKDKIAAASSTLVANYHDATTVIREAAINGLEAIEGIEGGHVTVTIDPIREYSATEGPVSPFAPADKSIVSANVTITDNGCGMSPDFVRNGLVKIKVSTKDNDETKGGGHGIGSKGALAYADTVAWRTTKDGKTTTVVLGRDSREGFGFDDPVTVETGEPNGTTVTFTVSGATYRDISRTIEKNFTAYMNPETLTVTMDGAEIPVGGMFRGDNFYRINDSLSFVVEESEFGNRSEDKVLFYGAPYPVPSNGFGLSHTYRNAVDNWIHENNLDGALRFDALGEDHFYSTVRTSVTKKKVFTVNIDSLHGKVFPLPNREAIQNTEDVRKGIDDLVENAVKSTLDAGLNDVRSAKTTEEWRKKWKEFTSNGIVMQTYASMGTKVFAPAEPIGRYAPTKDCIFGEFEDGEKILVLDDAFGARNTQNTMNSIFRGLNYFLGIENSSKMCDYSYMCDTVEEFIGVDADYVTNKNTFFGYASAMPDDVEKTTKSVVEFITGATVVERNMEAMRKTLMSTARKEVGKSTPATYIEVYLPDSETPKKVANASGLYSIIDKHDYDGYIVSESPIGDPRIPYRYADAVERNDELKQSIFDAFESNKWMVIRFVGYEGESTMESLGKRYGFYYPKSTTDVENAVLQGIAKYCGVSMQRAADARFMHDNNVSVSDMARFIESVTLASKDEISEFTSDMKKVFGVVFEEPKDNPAFIDPYTACFLPSGFSTGDPAALDLIEMTRKMVTASNTEDTRFMDRAVFTERFLHMAPLVRQMVESTAESYPQPEFEEEAA